MDNVIEGRRSKGSRRADTDRASWAAVIRLAIVVSALAALSTVALSAVTEVSANAMVLTVIVIGFATSWFRTAPAPADAASS